LSITINGNGIIKRQVVFLPGACFCYDVLSYDKTKRKVMI